MGHSECRTIVCQSGACGKWEAEPLVPAELGRIFVAYPQFSRELTSWEDKSRLIL